MLNWIWIILVVSAIAYGGAVGTLDAVNASIIESAKAAVNLVIGIVGVMAMYLGAMRVAFDGGLRDVLARVMAPALRRLFPEVPSDHPAMTSMLMNMSSNALGLANAATPFGLKAMKELETLNKEPGTATNAMVRFLAINTSGLALLPTGIIGLRALKESADPAAIFPTPTSVTLMQLCKKSLDRFGQPAAIVSSAASVTTFRPPRPNVFKIRHRVTMVPSPTPVTRSQP